MSEGAKRGLERGFLQEMCIDKMHRVSFFYSVFVKHTDWILFMSRGEHITYLEFI